MQLLVISGGLPGDSWVCIFGLHVLGILGFFSTQKITCFGNSLVFSTPKITFFGGFLVFFHPKMFTPFL